MNISHHCPAPFCGTDPIDPAHECIELDVLAQIFHEAGADTSTFGQQLYDALVEACDDIKDLPAVVDTFDPCQTIVISSGGAVIIDGVPSAAPSEDPDGIVGIVAGTRGSGGGDSFSAYGTSAIVIAGVLVLLFFALFVRRRNRDSYSMKHHSLDDDGEVLEDDTFFDGASSPGSVLFDPNATPRKSHIVGEEDSIFSGWTGYDMAGRNLDDSYDGPRRGGPRGVDEHAMTQDVHRCASATCEICELRRQAGIQFLPTMPSHSGDSVPENATRVYETRDTIAL